MCGTKLQRKNRVTKLASYSQSFCLTLLTEKLGRTRRITATISYVEPGTTHQTITGEYIANLTVGRFSNVTRRRVSIMTLRLPRLLPGQLAPYLCVRYTLRKGR